MTDKPITDLRRRMLQDMTNRNFVDKTKHDYIRHVEALADFLGRSPDTVTGDDLRRFQAAQIAGIMRLAIPRRPFWTDLARSADRGNLRAEAPCDRSEGLRPARDAGASPWPQPLRELESSGAQPVKAADAERRGYDTGAMSLTFPRPGAAIRPLCFARP